MAWGLVCAIGAAVAFGFGALLQAVVARREEATERLDPRLLLRLLRHPAYSAVLVLYLGGFALHFVALRTAPLFLAQAIISSSVAVTAVLAAATIGAPFGPVERVSVVAVCAGLFVLAVGAGGHGDVATTTGQRALLLAVTGAIVILGVVVGRFHGETASLGLSLLSGSGYAVVALAARMLPSYDPVSLVTDPATYALVVSGVVAFLLYSTALQRAGILASTSAVVVTQTAVPAAVGVALLGDTVQAGWALPAVVAFAVAMAGVVVLSVRDTLSGAARAVPEGVAVAPGPGVGSGGTEQR